MSKWTERIENHAIHKGLDVMESRLDDLKPLAESDPDVLETYDRLSQIRGATVSRLGLMDPIMVPVGILNNMKSHLDKLNSQIASYVSNKNATHLNNANTHADNLLTQLGNLPVVDTEREVGEVRESITSFRMSVGQYMRYLEQEKTKLSKELKRVQSSAQETEQEIKSQKARLDTALSNFQKQFSEAESKRSERNTTAERERDQKFESVLEASKQKTEDYIGDKDAEWSKFLQTAKDERRSEEEEFRRAGQGLVATLESQKEEAINIVGIIADTGMVGGFQKEADSERKWAIGWSVVTVMALVGLIAFAVSAFMVTVSGGFDIGLFGARVFVAGSFGILAAYAARQADKHRISERKNRRLELEIKSIGPYLNELPETERNEIKRKLADRMFGRIDEQGQNGQSEATTGSLIDLLRMAIQGLSKD